ncbi:MAG: hypothetical protein ACXAEF_05545 [Candidatus Thorarchaeota archaeon]
MEEIPLQIALDELTLVYIVVPLLIGVVAGYAIWGQKTLRATERILYGGIVRLIGGIMVGLIIAAYLGMDQFSILLAVLSFAGGCAFGMGVNWAPTPEKGPQRHVVFDPEEEDEEFDRQIEEAFRGSES